MSYGLDFKKNNQVSNMIFIVFLCNHFVTIIQLIVKIKKSDSYIIKLSTND